MNRNQILWNIILNLFLERIGSENRVELKSVYDSYTWNNGHPFCRDVDRNWLRPVEVPQTECSGSG